MKINKNTPTQSDTVTYDIETEYGLLKCTFNPEKINEHFHYYFVSFSKNYDDFISAKPSFEKLFERATDLVAERLQERLKEVFEETINEARLSTLMEAGAISRKEAALIINKEIKKIKDEKKTRLNAPSSGRPKDNSSETLRNAVIEQIRQTPKYFNPGQDYVADKLGMKSGDALRKELKRHNLVWKELQKIGKELKNGHNPKAISSD